MRAVTIVLWVVLSLMSSRVSAETYCVNTPAQLLAAVQSAFGNSASEIRVQTGSYHFSASAEVPAIQIFDPSDITLSGGWNVGCTAISASNADQTILSAQNQGRLLYIGALFPNQSSTISLRRLSFRSGVHDGTNAACVTIETGQDSAVEIHVEHNAFRLCNNPGGPGGLHISGYSIEARVRNNVVMDNSSAVGALSLRGFGGSTFYASNNTIVNNVTAVNGAPGVQLSGVATDFHWFINNVMWNNRILGGGPFRDLVLLAPAGVVNSNSYRELLNGSGSMAISQSITAEPLFVSPTNPRLTPGSPLRDSGNNTPAGGILPIDFDLQPRFQGGQLDRGAFELSDVLFKNGFQNP